MVVNRDLSTDDHYTLLRSGLTNAIPELPSPTCRRFCGIEWPKPRFFAVAQNDGGAARNNSAVRFSAADGVGARYSGLIASSASRSKPTTMVSLETTRGRRISVGSSTMSRMSWGSESSDESRPSSLYFFERWLRKSRTLRPEKMSVSSSTVKRCLKKSRTRGSIALLSSRSRLLRQLVQPGFMYIVGDFIGNAACFRRRLFRLGAPERPTGKLRRLRSVIHYEFAAHHDVDNPVGKLVGILESGGIDDSVGVEDD